MEFQWLKRPFLKEVRGKVIGNFYDVRGHNTFYAIEGDDGCCYLGKLSIEADSPSRGNYLTMHLSRRSSRGSKEMPFSIRRQIGTEICDGRETPVYCKASGKAKITFEQIPKESIAWDFVLGLCH